MVILPNMAKTVKRPLFHYFFAFFHILRCPYHGFSGHRVFLTHFWGCMRGGLWVLCAEVQKSQNASPVLKVLPPPRGGGGEWWCVCLAVSPVSKHTPKCVQYSRGIGNPRQCVPEALCTVNFTFYFIVERTVRLRFILQTFSSDLCVNVHKRGTSIKLSSSW